MPLPVFYALVLANGNFIRPGAFVFDKYGNSNIKVMMKSAALKLAAVVLLFGGLFVTQANSRAPIAVGSMAYLAGIKWVHGEVFENMFKAGVGDNVTPKAKL